jgi:hypothetical protein
MSRRACGYDSGRGKDCIKGSRYVSDYVYKGRNSVYLLQAVAGFLEGILGSSNYRAFFLFLLARF